MKFSEFIKEEQEVSLIGMTVDKRFGVVELKTGKNLLGYLKIIPETTELWEDNFICVNKGLTTLKGAPKQIKGAFDCARNNITSLKDGPKIVGNYYDCSQNKLTSLKGAPKKLNSYFTCSSNKLTSLEGAPKEIDGGFSCNNNDLKNLKNIHKMINKINGEFYCYHNPIQSHVLGLLLIPGIIEIHHNYEWADILNKYLGKGRKGLIDCQNELIEAEYEEFAQL